MNITVTTKLSRDKTKRWYYFESGKGKGQRWASKLWTFENPGNKAQRVFNKNQLTLLDQRRLEQMLNKQEVVLKTDFLAFYKTYVTDNERPGKRHLPSSLREFKSFCEAKKVNPDALTTENVIAFRRYLLDNFNGETPLNYFACFKAAVKSASKAGYFAEDPAADVKGKKNQSKERDFLLPDEFKALFLQPCGNDEVRRAFLFSMLTGLAYCDVKEVRHEDIRDGVLRINRKKSKVLARVPLNEVALSLIVEGQGKIFNLPGSANGSNKALQIWVTAAGINKKITWHCARHSFSIELLRNGTAATSVAGLMGHKSTDMVNKIYKRYIDSDGAEAVKKIFE